MVDSRIRFRHLRTFVEAARQRSIGRAAEVLNVTQPAVSKTIRELETILAVKLFEKDGRGIRVTRHGEVFLHHAGASIAAIQQGIDSVSGAHSGPPIRVGALPTVSARIMPKVMDVFLKEETDSPVKVVTGENQVLLDQLRAGALDLVIGRLAAPEQMSGLHFEYLYSELVRFVVRRGHPLLAAQRFHFSLVRNHTVLMPPTGSVIRPIVDQFLLSHGQGTFPGVIETVSDSFGRAFTAETDAVWIISEGVVARDLASGSLYTLPIDTTDTRGAVGLTFRRSVEPSPTVAILLHILKDVLRSQKK